MHPHPSETEATLRRLLNDSSARREAQNRSDDGAPGVPPQRTETPEKRCLLLSAEEEALCREIDLLRAERHRLRSGAACILCLLYVAVTVAIAGWVAR